MVVDSFITPVTNGNEDAEAKKYINYALEKQMIMENLDFEVTNVTDLGPSTYLVDIYVEDKYFYRDGTGDQKKINAQYKINIVNNQYEIDDITSLTVIEKTTF